MVFIPSAVGLNCSLFTPIRSADVTGFRTCCDKHILTCKRCSKLFC